VEAREQVKQLAGLIPLCPQCHRPSVPEPPCAQAGTCLAPTPSEPLSAALCDDCRRRVAPGNPSFPHQHDVGASVPL
jgi:hypothetical protein